MFTLDQIKAAHTKVNSGADFPDFIQDLIGLGVSHYETFVADGHSIYFGANQYRVASPAQYETITIAAATDKDQFETDLKAHQDGKTDYVTFCYDSASSGIEKWTVFLDEMTCTYFDKSGKEILVEVIAE